MPVDSLLQRCRDAAAIQSDEPLDADSLIGFFQTFRPDGRGLSGVFQPLPGGAGLHERLERLFDAAGDDRRPQGGRDAYFIVRQPPAIQPERVETLAASWLANLRQLAQLTGDQPTASRLDPLPNIRVLEGIPPKHPKADAEKTQLLKTFETSIPTLVERIEPNGEFTQLLRPAYYFVNCNEMLRDYLMWPLYAQSVNVDDPFQPYFELWRHGIKYRIFREDLIDFYIPRPSAG